METAMNYLPLQVSKSSPKNKSHLTVWPSSDACVATISLFCESSNEEFLNTCNEKPAVLRNYNMF